MLQFLNSQHPSHLNFNFKLPRYREHFTFPFQNFITQFFQYSLSWTVGLLELSLLHTEKPTFRRKRMSSSGPSTGGPHDVCLRLFFPE